MISNTGSQWTARVSEWNVSERGAQPAPALPVERVINPGKYPVVIDLALNLL